jgi:hypothetical protein
MFYTNGDDLRVHGSYRYVSGVYAGVENTVNPRARLVSEGIRREYGQVFIPEINASTAPGEPNSPAKFNDWRLHPIALDPGETLNAQTVNNPAAATDQFVLLWMTDGQIRPVDPAGGFWTRWTTAASAMTANTWNARALTPDTNLQTGTYEVLGAQCRSTTAITARFAFEGQTNKPGVLGTDAEADVPYRAFELPGSWGSFGQFHTNNPPTLELLADAADNEAQEVRLFVRRLRRG